MHFTCVEGLKQRLTPFVLRGGRALLWGALQAFPDLAGFFRRRVMVVVLSLVLLWEAWDGVHALSDHRGLQKDRLPMHQTTARASDGRHQKCP